MTGASNKKGDSQHQKCCFDLDGGLVLVHCHISAEGGASGLFLCSSAHAGRLPQKAC